MSSELVEGPTEDRETAIGESCRDKKEKDEVESWVSECLEELVLVKLPHFSPCLVPSAPLQRNSLLIVRQPPGVGRRSRQEKPHDDANEQRGAAFEKKQRLPSKRRRLIDDKGKESAKHMSPSGAGVPQRDAGYLLLLRIPGSENIDNKRRCANFNGAEEESHSHQTSEVLARSMEHHDGAPNHDHDREELGERDSLHHEGNR